MEEFSRAVIETIRANGYKSCYIRPIIYRGYNTLGVDPFPNPVDCAILVWEWGKYLGDEALENGVDVKVSTWWRIAPNTFPALAKSGANYMNSQLIKMEALLDGYAEGIALNIRGHISEGSGENIFLVQNGAIYTPPLSSSVLPGITRDSVITLIGEMGLRLIEETIPREMLYIAEEVFFTGSAAEITPIRSIDKITIGTGKRGPVVKKLQEAFFSYIKGEREDTFNWLTFV
jgi:branched-chain amino acid aminotransferase